MFPYIEGEAGLPNVDAIFGKFDTFSLYYLAPFADRSWQALSGLVDEGDNITQPDASLGLG